MINAREMAPLNSYEDMYTSNPEFSVNGGLAV